MDFMTYFFVILAWFGFFHGIVTTPVILYSVSESENESKDIVRIIVYISLFYAKCVLIYFLNKYGVGDILFESILYHWEFVFASTGIIVSLIAFVSSEISRSSDANFFKVDKRLVSFNMKDIINNPVHVSMAFVLGVVIPVVLTGNIHNVINNSIIAKIVIVVINSLLLFVSNLVIVDFTYKKFAGLSNIRKIIIYILNTVISISVGLAYVFPLMMFMFLAHIVTNFLITVIYLVFSLFGGYYHKADKKAKTVMILQKPDENKLFLVAMKSTQDNWITFEIENNEEYEKEKRIIINLKNMILQSLEDKQIKVLDKMKIEIT